MEKEKKNHPLGTRLFEHQRKVSSVKRVEFVSVRLSYTILRGRCSEGACTKWGGTWLFKRQILWGIRAGFFYHFPKYRM